MLFIAFEDFPISIIESEPTGINPCIEEVGGIHNFQVKVPIGIKSGAKEAHVRKYQFHKFFFNHRHAFFLSIYYDGIGKKIVKRSKLVVRYDEIGNICCQFFLIRL